MAATTTKTPAIYGKIAAIQSAVGAIPKNGKGPAQKGGFAYIKAEDILDKVHALLVEHEVITVPTIKHTNFEVYRDGGRAYTNVSVEIAYELIAVEDGSSITVTSVGEGSDIGSDTATRKAATMALKIMQLHTFTIPNTDQLLDDEGYEPVAKDDKPAPKAVAAAKNAKAATPSTGADAKQKSITALRAAVKVAAAPLGLTPTQINERGSKLSADFFNDAEALAKLEAELKAEAEAK